MTCLFVNSRRKLNWVVALSKRSSKRNGVARVILALLVHSPKRCQQKLRVKSDRVVWIHIGELDTPIGGYNVDARNRQLMVLLTRGGLQIHPMAPKLLQSPLVDFVRNAESLRPSPFH